ncbi:MAG: hypothetical protein WDA06_03030 [Phenylobacterium sp.]
MILFGHRIQYEKNTIIIEGIDWTELVPVLLGKSYEEYSEQFESLTEAEDDMYEKLRESIACLMFEFSMNTPLSEQDDEYHKAKTIRLQKVAYLREFLSLLIDNEDDAALGKSFLLDFLILNIILLF